MSDVYLVQMPYSLVNRPSMGLSLLSAYLRAAEIDTEIVYANLTFADEIGLDVYRAVEESPPHDLLGEWTFARAAFGAVPGDAEEYFRLVRPAFEGQHVKVLHRVHPELDFEDLLHLLRRRAGDFVDRVARRILAGSPRIVGCTSMFQQHVPALALLRRVRELAPQVVTMIGGANCEGVMGRATLELFPWVDYVASGEADGYIAGFCRRILDGDPPHRAEELPVGVFGRRERLTEGAALPLGAGREGALHLAEGSAGAAGEAPIGMMDDLDDTAIPDFDEYFAAFSQVSFAGYVEPTLPLETSRGCWWGQAHHCTFCGLSDLGMVFRSKSPDRVVAELRQLAERYGVRRFETVDEILDMSFLRTVMPRLAELAEEEGEEYTLFYEVKSNLKREQLELLARAGVREVQPGIESLHDAVLEHFDKGNNGLMNIQFLKWGGELGIRVGWNFLFGAPGEKDEWYAEVAERVPLLHHLQPPGCTSRIGYHRFSPYQTDPERFGIELQARKAYRHVYPVDAEELEDLAYYFEDYGDPDRGQIDPTLPRSRRPGLEAAWTAVKRWREAYYDSSRGTPVLLAEPAGEGVRVRDTRQVTAEDEHLLDAWTATVLRLCRTAATERALARRVEAELGRPVPGERIAAALAELRDRKLILQDGERFLSLVLDQVRPIPAHEESAGGAIRLLDFTEDFAARSLAAACARLPERVPVRELFSAR